MKVTLFEYPTTNDWLAVKKRALVTIGKDSNVPPDPDWRHSILEARHSPIRRLWFGFYLEGIPSWVATHLARHVHAQPYIRSQRNDRQADYDRNKAPQDAPVDMILDVNGEELQVLCNKRLCGQASPETREIVARMASCVRKLYPKEFEGLLVPMCKYHGGVCHEMKPCKEEWRPLTDYFKDSDRVLTDV